MKISTIFMIATLSICVPAFGDAAGKPAAQVKAAKGPVQITFSLQKTTVRTKDSLWYKLELMNIGKSRMKFSELIFKKPWAMHENIGSRRHIYIEMIGPNGKPVRVNPGGERVKYDWELAEGDTFDWDPDEMKELDALEADMKRRGLSRQQQSIALSKWNDARHHKKNRAEYRDPTKKLWLEPGASTTTFAWIDSGPDGYDGHEYEGRAEDDRALRDGYAQLWSYWFLDPGVYRVRATYDFSMDDKTLKLLENGDARAMGWFAFSTPFITVEVLP